MLPELHHDPDIPNTWVGTLTYNERKVTLRIDPDDATKDQCLASALLAVQSIDELDKKAKDVAAAELLSSYNENWRHYSQARADGSFEDVSDPEHTASTFKQRLTLNSIQALGSTCYTLFYHDDNMFWGHSVIITSFDGLGFSDTHAELFG